MASIMRAGVPPVRSVVSCASGIGATSGICQARRTRTCALTSTVVPVVRHGEVDAGGFFVDGADLRDDADTSAPVSGSTTIGPVNRTP